MIHLDYIHSVWHGTNPYTSTVESFEILENDSNEVVLRVPKVSVLGMLIETDASDNLEVYVSADSEVYYPYCIINRSTDTNTAIDKPQPLVIQLSDAGKFTYIIDRPVTITYVKLRQQNDANISIIFLADSVF